MKKLIVGFTSSVLLFGLAGCANMTNQDVGVLTGGAVGGAVGSLFGSGSGQILATVGGTVVGAMIGGAIGASMDRQDQMQLNQALENEPSGQVSTWRNPDSGNTYYVTPRRTYSRGPQHCRDFTTKAVINGKVQLVQGTACRRPNGTWRMINS
jgi:surface antigen